MALFMQPQAAAEGLSKRWLRTGFSTGGRRRPLLPRLAERQIASLRDGGRGLQISRAIQGFLGRGLHAQ
jgi:hypothetical protein